MFHFRGNNDNQTRNDTSTRRHRGFTFRPPKAHERPLLTSSRRNSPDKITFRVDNAQDKFRDVNDLTESDETDMDLSDSNDTGHRPSKRPRVGATDTTEPAAPKWSNPDPYTALPPLDESSRKKKDVVKLIRKARNTPKPSEHARISATNDDDFISFDIEDEQWYDEGLPPHNAPTGPRLHRRSIADTDAKNMVLGSDIQTNGDAVLGKRKRAEFKNRVDPVIKSDEQFYSDGLILREWQASQDCNPSPWLKQDPDPTDLPGIA
jgi:non-canonical poly(A) RNA polymerase PAPD5/7